MVFPNLREPITPSFDIFINGKSLSNISFDIFSHLVRMVVDDDTELPSMFTLEFTGSENSDNAWLNDYNLFTIGAEVEVKFGYGNQIETLIIGEITGLEPRFSVSEPLSLIVRGYDRRHRLQRGRKTRSFVDQKDSQIASRIAREVSLSAQVTDSLVIHPYVLQANQTDWEFLQQRAKQIHYEVVVEGKNLFFRPVNNGNSPNLTLSLNDNLLEFNPCLSSVGQVEQVTVRSWDFQQNAAITGNSSNITDMGGRQNGAVLSRQAFGNAIAQISNHPIFNQSEADQLAVAQLNRIALNLVTGEGVSLGITDLRAGRVIEIQDIGDRFSGRYYLTSVSHRYSYEGYYTHFCVRRNAS